MSLAPLFASILNAFYRSNGLDKIEKTRAPFQRDLLSFISALFISVSLNVGFNPFNTTWYLGPIVFVVIGVIFKLCLLPMLLNFYDWVMSHKEVRSNFLKNHFIEGYWIEKSFTVDSQGNQNIHYLSIVHISYENNEMKILVIPYDQQRQRRLLYLVPFRYDKHQLFYTFTTTLDEGGDVEGSGRYDFAIASTPPSTCHGHYYDITHGWFHTHLQKVQDSDIEALKTPQEQLTFLQKQQNSF